MKIRILKMGKDLIGWGNLNGNMEFNLNLIHKSEIFLLIYLEMKQITEGNKKAKHEEKKSYLRKRWKWMNYNTVSLNHHMCAGAPWLCRHTHDAFRLVELLRARSCRAGKMVGRDRTPTAIPSAHCKQGGRSYAGLELTTLTCVWLFVCHRKLNQFSIAVLRDISCENITVAIKTYF